MRWLVLVGLLASCDDGVAPGNLSDMAATACNPPCSGGALCCSEPSHMVNDAGMQEARFICVQPTPSGQCPQFP